MAGLNEETRLLTETEAASILHLAVATLQRWRWSGEGPLFVKLRSAVRYRLVDIEKFVADGVRNSTSDRGPSATRGLSSVPPSERG